MIVSDRAVRGSASRSWPYQGEDAAGQCAGGAMFAGGMVQKIYKR
jgi:hypothetical protein